MSPRPAIVAGLFLAACTAAPAPPPPVARGIVEVTDPELAARIETLCAKLEEERVELHIPGMAIAVVLDDEIVLAKGFGLADLEEGYPATPETLFAIGSSTKAFTATTIGILVDDGRMEWDDPIADHLPWFTPELETDDEDAVLTVRDTLCHDSGFARMDILWGSGKASRKQILRTASGAKAWEEFRDGFNYNNVMFLAAGEASAAAAGRSWDALVKERLFDPLRMYSTNTSVVESRADPRLALGYRWDEDAEEHVHLPMRVLDSVAPAGAINSNVLDMAQWLRFQLGDGVYEGERLISEAQLNETRTRQNHDPDYGLGWFLGKWNGQPVVQHGGNIDGFGAQVAFLPESHLGYVLLTNVTATPLQGGSMQIVWETLLGEEEARSTEAAGGAPDFDEYVGDYVGDFGPWDEATFEVLVKDERLAVDVPGQIVYTLHPPDEEGKWTFTLTDTIAVSFERDENGDVQVMHLHQAGMEFELPRAGYEFPLEIDLDEVQRYLGRYRDDELDDEVEIRVDGNRLAADVPGQMAYHLRPPDEDGWWWFRISPELAVRFEEGEDGGITGLTFHERGEERSCPRTGGPGGPEGDLPTLEEILALRKADERAAAVRALGVFRIEGTLRMVHCGIEGAVVLTAAGTDRMVDELDLGLFGHHRQIVNPEGGWLDSSFRPEDELSGAQLEQTRQGHPSLLFGDWRELFPDAAVRSAGFVEGRKVYVVALRGEGTPDVRAHVDAENGDLVRLEYETVIPGIGTLPVEIEHGDFREEHGVRIPYRIVTTDIANGRMELTVESFDAHLDLDDDFFTYEPPPGD